MNLRHSSSKIIYLLFPLILFVLTSCAAEVDRIQADGQETAAPTASVATPTETPEATMTAQPTATAVPTAVVTVPSANVLSSTPTPMPTATLTSEQKTENLAELMRTNGGCALPCWWGIVPGETNVETARNDLTNKGFRWGEDNSAGMRVTDDFGVFVEFEIEAAIIQSIGASGDYLTGTQDSLAYSRAFARGWQHYSLAGILNRHGLPTQVLVYSPFRADPGNGPAYHLLVFYEQLGIEIEYTGSAEQLNGARYRACPDLADIWDISLFLYQPGQVDSVVERVLPSDSISYIAGPETVYERISWEEATGTSLQYFYDTFSRANSEACFEFSAG